MLYTRKGDNGMSGLFGTKERFPKESPLYEALGTLDELNSLLGLCRARAKNLKDKVDIPSEIERGQECLFIVQAELAGAGDSVSQTEVKELEKAIGQIEDLIKNPHAFVIPGATELSAWCDYARAVARRAEREVIRATSMRNISPESRAYLNRLSSFLYALARYAATREGVKELSPSY